MTNNKYLTNQELLTELKDQLPNFTEEELHLLLVIIQPHQEKFLKIIQQINPQVHGWIQEKQQQLDQEKTDKKTQELNKSLEK